MARCVLGVERSFLGRPWHLRLDEAGLRGALAIAQTEGVPDLVARVLASRRVDAGASRAYLSPSLRESMPDPDTLADMPAAVERLTQAVERREKVGLIGDYDVDGATSAALLTGYLRAAGVPVRVHIPDRITEGYGPSVEAVTRMAKWGSRLLVTVDCGSASHGPLAEAARLGIDTVIIDHHQIELPFPRAVAVVNPNRPDDLSGLGYLSAAGVTFMVVAALNRTLKAGGFWSGREAPDLLASLDLVALGTVADVVPLVGLNRALVVKGLAVMRSRGRPGLAALFDVAGADGPPDTFQLGFLIGPRINAGGRIGDATLGVRLLLADDPLEARRIATELDALNRDRRKIEAHALERAEAEALASLAAGQDGPVLVAAGEGWHPGIMGLVAARLRERFERPAFAIALAEGVGTGSGRSVPGADLGRAVRMGVQAGVLQRGGGHAMAAGLTIEAGKVAAFREFLGGHFNEDLKAFFGPGALSIDSTLSAAGASVELLGTLVQAGPFGSGSPEPVVVFPNHRLLDLSEAAGDHLRLTLAGPDGTRIRAIAFRAARTDLHQGLAATRGHLVHCAGTMTINRRGGGTPCVELRLLDAALATNAGS